MAGILQYLSLRRLNTSCVSSLFQTESPPPASPYLCASGVPECALRRLHPSCVSAVYQTVAHRHLHASCDPTVSQVGNTPLVSLLYIRPYLHCGYTIPVSLLCARVCSHGGYTLLCPCCVLNSVNSELHPSCVAVVYQSVSPRRLRPSCVLAAY